MIWEISPGLFFKLYEVILHLWEHVGRVATLDWNQHTLASGGREGEIHLHDVRVAEHHVATLQAHSQVLQGNINMYIFLDKKVFVILFYS